MVKRFRVPLSEHVAISTIMSDMTNCSWCNKSLKKGQILVSIYKSNNTGTPINVWVHIDCINLMNDVIKQVVKEKGPEMMVHNL